MSGRDRRRMEGDRNHRPDIGRVASAASHFAGTVVDEYQDRRQPFKQPEGDRNHRPDIGRVASAASHFAGTVVDEYQDRRQPFKQPRDRGASGELGARNDSRNNRVIPVPYVKKTGLLRQNNIIFICGVPHPNARRFTVYLQQGNGHEPHLIAMCVDARFVFGADRNIVVRNHKDGGWGREERDLSYFPFKEDKNFEMIILVEKNCFKVAVNNKHMLEFKHRIRALDGIDTLRITGDVTLTQVRIQD